MQSEVYSVYMRPGKQKILAAAIRLYERGGAEHVTMRKVGTSVGVTPMAIYRHYRDRDDLLEAIAAAAFDAWALRAQAIGARDPLDWIRRLMVAYLDFALIEPARFRAAFLLSTGTVRCFPSDFAAGRSPVGRIALIRIEECLRRKQLQGGDPLEMEMTLWAQGHGLIVLFLAGRFSCDARGFRKIYLRSIDSVLRGFGARRYA